MSNRNDLRQITGEHPTIRMAKNLNSDNSPHNYSRNRHGKRDIWARHLEALNQRINSCRAGEDLLPKVMEMLTSRGMTEQNATRLMAKFLIKGTDSPWVLVYTDHSDATSKSLSVRSKAVEYDGKFYHAKGMKYDYMSSGYIPKQVASSRRQCYVITPNLVEGLSSEIGTSVGTAYAYEAFIANPVDVDGTFTTPSGEVLTRVANNDHSQHIFLTPAAMENRVIRRRWDSSYVLESITSLQGRGSTALLKGQPGLSADEAAIGIELELEYIQHKPDLIEKVTDSIRSKLGWVGSVTAVSDGSLQNGGAEFVTGWGRPELVAGALDQVMDEFNFRSERGEDYCASRCGLHIHVSRSFFGGNLNVARTQWMVENREFKDIVSKIAGRYNTSYCEADKTSPRYEKTQGGKYRAVNTEHSASVEFRIFSAPKAVGSVRRYADFCIACIEWVKTEPRLWTRRAFKLWMLTQDKYADLYAYLFSGEAEEVIVSETVAIAQPVPAPVPAPVTDVDLAQVAVSPALRPRSRTVTAVPTAAWVDGIMPALSSAAIEAAIAEQRTRLMPWGINSAVTEQIFAQTVSATESPDF